MGGLVEMLAGFWPEQLDQARLRTDLLSRRKPSQRPLVVQSEDLDLDPRLCHPLANEGVAQQACGGALLPEPGDRLLLAHLLAPNEAAAALVGKDRVRHPPALVLRTDEVLDGDLDLVEEDLVELAVTGHLAQRTDVDTLRVH